MSGSTNRRKAVVALERNGAISRSRRSAVAMFAAAAAIGLSPVAQAGSFYWTGDHNNLWNATGGATGTNWSSSPDFNNDPATLPGSADNVFFILFGAGNLNTQLGQNFSINSLTFTPDAVAANPITIGGSNLLTLGAGGLVDNSPATITLSTNVAVGAVQTWVNNSTVPLTVSGILSGSSNLTLGGTGASSGTATGAFVFSNANTYSGAIALSNTQTSLTINGAGSFASVTGFTLNGGSSLILDNTGTNSSTRVGSTVGITSLGGAISLLGNGSAPTSQTVGTLALGSGLTNVSLTPNSGQAATLTFGSPTATSFSRTTGAAVNFSTTGTIATPNVALDAGGLIGGWATIGNVGVVQQDAAGAGNVLDFATVSGGNVVAATNYVNNNAAADFVTANNVKVSAAVTLTNGTTSTVNSLYFTGASSVILGTVNTTGTKLIIGNGGIISNAATQTLDGSGPQIPLTNSADLGSGVINSTGNGVGGAITGTITSASGDLVVTTASNLRIDAVIANNGSTVVNLTKDGSGTLDLSDGNGTAVSNTYTGITTINGGLLTIKGDLNLGAVPTVNTPNSLTLNGGELRMFATITLNSHRGITVGPQGGTISYNGGNTTILSGYQVTGNGSVTYSDIPGFGGVSANKCAMNIAFGATNYQGGTTFFTEGSTNAGIDAVIFFTANNEVPATSPVTVTNIPSPQNGVGLLNLFGTTQTFGSLAGNGNILNGLATTAALTVGGNNLSTTYSGNLGTPGLTWTVGGSKNAGGDFFTAGATTSTAITLTKIGTGTMTLSGVNGYTGATAINGGAVLVTGSLANTPVTVGNGTLIGSLGGSGTIAGTVTVTSTGHLSPAVTPITTSTLTINNNLTLNGGATLDYNFAAAGTPGTGDLVNVTGTGNVVLNAGADVLNVTGLSGFGIGTYNLISVTGTGTLTDNATFTVNGTTLFNYAVAPSGNNLVLTVTNGNPSLFWTGSVNGSWDASTGNWTGAAAVFANGDNVTFDDADLATGGATTISVVAGGVSPNSITFNNALNNFTFAGGPITVTANAGIVKNQGGNATFNNTVTTPLADVVGGTLTVGGTGTFNSTSQVKVESGAMLAVNGVLNTPLLTVKAGATGLSVSSTGSLASTTGLVVNAPATFNNAVQTVASLGDTSGATTGTVTLNGTTLTVAGTSQFDGVISGAGSLTVNNGAVFTLTNANLYSNGTTASGGTLAAKNASGSATGTGPVAVNSGGILGGSGFIGGAVTLSATGAGHLQPGVGSGGVATTLTINNNLTLNSGSVLDYGFNTAPSSDSVQVNGNLTLNAGNDVLNVNSIGSGVSSGTYKLFGFTGTLTDNATFTINGLPAGDTVSVLTPGQPGGVAGQLVLSIVAPSVVKWTGAAGTSGAGAWDTTSVNWAVPATPTPTPTAFPNGTPAIFDNSGAFPGVATTITVTAGGVTPAGVTFNNGGPAGTATPYTFTGGPINGSGSLTLSASAGQVTLTAANGFSGGVVINGGQLLVGNATGAGSGPIAVNAGGLLSVGTTGAVTIANPINLASGSSSPSGIGVVPTSTGAITLSGMLTATTGTTSIIQDFDPVGNTTPNQDILVTGVLAGGGTIIVPAVPGNPRDNTGVRFRGSGSTFTGTIVVQNSTKFELQANAGGGSPIGTGSVIFQAGTYVGPGNQGTFPVINMRNSTGANAVFGNNLAVTGNGAVFFNQLTGVAGSTSTWGNLKVGGSGATQTLLTGASAVNLQTMIFPTVTTEGGSVTFEAGIPGNTTYVDPDNFSLGPIAEDTTVSPAPVTSLTFNSTSTVTLTGSNTYAGSTTLQAGSVLLGVPGSLPAGTALTVNGGTMDFNNAAASNNQTVASLAGAGGIITNSDATNAHTLTAAQATNTTYSGAINGNLGLTKSNGGTLILAGTSNYTGPTTINGGILSVAAPGALGTTTVTVNSGGTLAGNATVGGAVNVSGGGNLAPSAGLTAPIGGPLTINGPLALTGGSTFAVVLASPTAGANPTGYDQVGFASTASLGGATLVINDAAYIAANPTVGDQFWIMDAVPGNTNPGQLSGVFAQGSTIFGGTIKYSIAYDVAGDPNNTGNDVLLTVTQVSVPEPASIGLLALGGLGLLARRRRRARA